MKRYAILIAMVFMAGTVYAAGEWGKTGTNPTIEKKANIASPVLVNPVFTTTITAGERLTTNSIIYLKSDGKAWKASNATALTGNGRLGVSMGNYSSTVTATIKTFGLHSSSAAFKVYSTGMPYYLSTGGTAVKTEPSAGGTLSRVIGWAMSKTKILFSPDSGWVTK
jgi:hypothetical protein